ncbi:MAG TPA: DinB family protein [Mucilaginibacter sp.]|nr:DinB family protein [Mucilaginibacter sp.]
MKNDLINELALTKADLLETLDQFSNHSINVIPFEDSWTAGQVAEHVFMSASAVASALNGPVKAADRDPEQHIQLFSQIFLNFDHKLKSPDFIIPSDEPKDKQALIDSLRETFNSIEHSANSGNLDMICTTFDMPTLGTLSREELIWFTTVHTQRHIHQLKNIAGELEKQNTNEIIQ